MGSADISQSDRPAVPASPPPATEPGPPQHLSGAAGPAVPDPAAVPGGSDDADRTVRVPKDPDRTVFRPASGATAVPGARVARRRRENDLSLWDDYGVTELTTPALDDETTWRVRLAQMLGASTLPLARVLAVAGVMLVTLLLLATLTNRLMALDTWISATSVATPASSQAPASGEPASPSGEPAPESSAAAPAQTPSMLPGAKECNPGVWAGPRTSCELANEVATKVAPKIAEPVVIKAFSTRTEREYRLECVPHEGITCTGLDGVEIYVWLVTQG